MHQFWYMGSMIKVYEEEDIPFGLVELQPALPQPVYQPPQELIQIINYLHQNTQKLILL
jgi:hypothetical protein